MNNVCNENQSQDCLNKLISEKVNDVHLMECMLKKESNVDLINKCIDLKKEAISLLLD